MAYEKLSPAVEFGIVKNEYLPGLTPEILAEIYAIGWHYGTPDGTGLAANVFRPETLGLESTLIIKAATAPGNRSLSVGKSDNFFIHPNLKINTGIVMWDTTLTIDEANTEIARINAKAEELGLYDPKTGERIEYHPTLPARKKLVEEVFSYKGAGVLIPPGKDPMEVLGEFDDPELLIAKALPVGYEGFIVVRRTDSKWVDAKLRITNDVFTEKGITDISKITREEYEALSNEIARRLRALE